MAEYYELRTNESFYNCSECSSQIEILFIDKDTIEFQCFNEKNPHKIKMPIYDYITKMQIHYIEINFEKCKKNEYHNKYYESYCLECNTHLCEVCLKSREHFTHDKINIKEVLPANKELIII